MIELESLLNRKVFLADKDAGLTDLIKSILSRKGFVVSTFESGAELIEAIGSVSCELVIIGDELQDIDGLGLAQKVRQISKKVKMVLVRSALLPPDIYNNLTRTLKVSWVAYRPIVAEVFQAQVELLLAARNENETRSKDEAGPTWRQKLVFEYIQGFPYKLEKLTALCAVHTEKWSLPELNDARRLAHNCKGTAGSFELAGLAESARRLEDQLLVHINSPSDWMPESAQLLVNLVADMSRESRRLYVDSVTTSLLKNEAKVESSHDISIESDFGSTEIESKLESKFESKTQISLASRPVIEAAFLTGSSSSFSSSQEDDDPDRDDFSGIRILVVSEEEHQSARKALQGLAVKLIREPDHDRAVSLAKNSMLDAALIELQSDKKKTGLDLARRLRVLPGKDNLPVGFITDSMIKEELGSATHAGMSLSLASPIKEKKLDEAIEYLVAARHGGRSRILVIDDDEDFADIVRNILGREGMLVKTLHETSNLIQTIHDFQPELILLDIVMPDVSGVDICQLLRAHPSFRDIPIIFLTAQTGLQTRLKAFASGGDDYLPKPVAAPELLMRVKVKLERARMLSERADRDGLTGLLMRRAFNEQVNAFISEAKRHQFLFTLAIIDLDHFKSINDTYGHLAGDRVLMHLGQLLKCRFRSEDVRGRWGGEEFVLAFKHLDKDVSKSALERTMDELRSHTFAGDEGQSFNVSFSSGLATYPREGETIQALLKSADSRLYKSKMNGRALVTAE